MGDWNEPELRRTVALIADLIDGQETAYHRYTPDQFRHRLRTHRISERESIDHLMKENIALKQDRAFYKCCALSGEVPEDGSEPSALPPTNPIRDGDE